MNIFYLDENPSIAAEYACDKHVVKMIVETAQLLSTAHRILDGEEYIDASSGRKIKRWKMLNNFYEKELYKATHINHPCAVWVRDNQSTYDWTIAYFIALLDEYRIRYNKVHKTSKIFDLVNYYPRNLQQGSFIAPPQTMPDKYKSTDTVEAYRNFYIHEKSKFATWRHRTIPDWFRAGSRNYETTDNASDADIREVFA
jgi:hypothetical protein